MITPELFLYRIPATEPDLINDVPDRLRRYLDSCRDCADGDLHSPASLARSTFRVEGVYECENGHAWTRGYTNP